MDESIKQFPNARMWLVQRAVCEQVMEEMGITIDENDTEMIKNICCNKIAYILWT
jgi:hypothetical protein